jgi:transcriptional regulator with XRE-family HTH domain
MEIEDELIAAGARLRGHRQALNISQRHLAESLGISPSVVCRAERGSDARLSTWLLLYSGVGYRARVESDPLCDEAEEKIAEETDERLERRREGLCVGKRRIW